MQKLIDPVCGMEVGEDALRAEGYDQFGFCCPACRKRFLDDPQQYLAGSGGGGGCGGHAGHDEGHGHHAERHGSGEGCCGGHGHH